MPRKPRIDAPGCLYHVLARGIERREIYLDAQDNHVFLKRLGQVVLDTGTPIYSFALLPNHFHLLLRRGKTPISTVMQKLLTSYAIYFNKRHDRCGHLFQNRYKSIICQEELYFKELLRYINLNPLRAGLVGTLEELPSYRYGSHGLILGKARKAWFDPKPVLAHFGRVEHATNAYLSFIREGGYHDRRPDLCGGGQKRSRQLTEDAPPTKPAFDDRVLGIGDFVERMHLFKTRQQVTDETELQEIFRETCRSFQVTVAELRGTNRNRRVTTARSHAALAMREQLGFSTSEIARRFSVTHRTAKNLLERAKTEDLSVKSIKSITTSPKLKPSS